jgi:hypothetical protein
MSKYACLAALLVLAGTETLAQNASSKATAAINTAVWCTLNTSTSGSISGIQTASSCTDLFSGAQVTQTPDNFVPIMTTSIKVSNSQSLFVTPSLVTGLYTNTAVKTKPGQSSTAVAMGGVYVRAVLLDPNTGNVVATAFPIEECAMIVADGGTPPLGCQQDANGLWGVIFDSRIQTLTQQLSDCTVSSGGVNVGSCTFDLTTQLILQTTAAHSFGFIFPNVGVGTYNVSIQAAVDANANTSGNSYAAGAAAFGLGSVTVESVRLVHNFAF